MAKQPESELRAKRNYRLRHPEKTREYAKWYYFNFTKAKRAAKRASALESRQSA
jgi:hypothetical protein